MAVEAKEEALIVIADLEIMPQVGGNPELSGVSQCKALISVSITYD